MLRISSVTLLISTLALFVAAHLDPRLQDAESFVTVPLVQNNNLTHPNGAFDIEAARRSILATRSMNRQNGMNLERRWTKEYLANNIPTIFRNIEFIDRLLPIKGPEKLTLVNRGPYTGKITIGTPPQTFSVGFATTLSISWIGIPDPNRKPIASGQESKLKQKNKYIASKSDTHMVDTCREHRIKANGDEKGKNKMGELCTAVGYRDTMTFANIEVKGQYFIGVVVPPSSDATRPEEGSIALGFKGLTRGSPSTFMDTALRRKQIKQAVFGVSFAPANPEFHFGGTNAQLYSNPIQFHKVIRPRGGGKALTYWLLGNAQVYVGKRLALDKLQTVISTDSLLTLGPSAQVDEIYKSVQGVHKVDDGLYMFPCTDGPKVKFSWDNQEQWEYIGFEIPADSTRLTNSRLMCYGSIAAYPPESKMGDRWQIGTSFLKNVYTGFDMGNMEVMFGKLRSK